MMRKHGWAVLAVLLVVAAGAQSARAGAVEDLHALFADEWAARLADNPLLATRAGVHDYDDRLPQVAPADFARRLDRDRAFLARLRAIPRDRLPAGEQLNYDLFAFVLSRRIERASFRDWRVPLLSDSGFHTALAHMADGVVMRTVADYENYLARLAAIPTYVDQNIANMRLGLDQGFTLPAVLVPRVAPTVKALIVEAPEESPFFTPFRRLPETLPAGERARLAEAARQTIAEQVTPAFVRFYRFLTGAYRQGARKTIGASDLPDGPAYYRFLVRYYTTLDVTPDEVHALGLREVKRIRTQMEAIIKGLDFKGNFADFLQFLRTDAQFYAKTPGELLREAAWIAKQIDGRMPAFFTRLPRLPYGIAPVPDDLAPGYTTGRYWGAPVGGRRGGLFMVNTYALDQRPLYVLPALTLHEAVPGHHHQIALARELDDLPQFRRALYLSAFGEGWALYAEKLGREMGLYDTPYKDFGRLTYEMWRASRLVVDTGIHAMGWSADKARRFMAENTALSLHNIETEVDRYISWPGQALAYKMGELKILELRERAEKALGPRFDLRRFHDAVLENGALPLPALERRIDAFIAAARGD